MTGTPPASSTPPGWYPDPVATGHHRYWDGTAWTAATNAPPRQPAGWYPDPVAPAALRYWNGAAWVGPPQSSSGQYGPMTQPSAGTVLVTPTGERFELSGWWRRVGGYVLDGLLVGVSFVLFELLVSLVAYGKVWGFVSIGPHHPAIAPAWLRVAMSVLSAGVTFAYAVFLIGRRRQTLGMQAVGITVIDVSGRALTRRQVWLRALYRVLFIDLASVVFGGVRIQGGTGGHAALSALATMVPAALTLVVYLWPLGSQHNQTLIDKAAGSVVVKGDRLGASVRPGDPMVR